MANILQAPVKTNILNPSKDKPQAYLPWLNRRQKNGDFVLNCDSADWKLPAYNSLNDRHLTYFFANPKVRSVLVKTGVVDENGNISKEKTKIGQDSSSNKFLPRQKLPPITEGTNLAIQRIVIPYQTKRNKSKLDKIIQSTPEKRVTTLGDAEVPPKKLNTYPMKVKGKSYGNIRKIQPLSKDQLAHIFVKYQVKTVQPNPSYGTDESTVAEETSTFDNERKSDGSLTKSKPQEIDDRVELTDKKSTPSPTNSNFEKRDEVIHVGGSSGQEPIEQKTDKSQNNDAKLDDSFDTA